MEKSISELIDELTIANIKLFHLVDYVQDDSHIDNDLVAEDARKIQKINQRRSDLKNAIERFFKTNNQEIKM